MYCIYIYPYIHIAQQALNAAPNLPAVPKCHSVKQTSNWAGILKIGCSNRGWWWYTAVDAGAISRFTGWSRIDF